MESKVFNIKMLPWTILKYLSLIFFSFVAVLPVVSCVITAFKTDTEYQTTNVMTMPQSWLNFDNFVQAFTRAGMGRAFANSLIILVNPYGVKHCKVCNFLVGLISQILGLSHRINKSREDSVLNIIELEEQILGNTTRDRGIHTKIRKSYHDLLGGIASLIVLICRCKVQLRDDRRSSVRRLANVQRLILYTIALLDGDELHLCILVVLREILSDMILDILFKFVEIHSIHSFVSLK